MRTNIGQLFLAAAAVAAAPAWAIGPDAFGYTATSQVAYSYQDISQTGATVLAGADDETATIQIGFGFKFYGVTYSNLCVSTNGLISFGGCWRDFANIDFTQQAPAAGGDLPMIAPFWTDLTFNWPGAGGIAYQTSGTAGSRKLIVQWKNVYGLNSPGPLNFQVILTEGTNRILLQYAGVEPGLATLDKGASATVGIRATGGQVTTAGNGNRLQWSYRVPVLRNSMAIEYTPPAAVSAVDVTSRVKVTLGSLIYNRTSNTYSQTILVTNTGATPIANPLTAVLTGLPAAIRVTNATGTGAEGPFITLPASAPLAAGASVSVTANFSGGTTTTIRYTTKVYSGAY
jgi:hypothetical protein